MGLSKKSRFLNLEMVEVDFPAASVTFTEYHDIESCLQYYTPIVTSRHSGDIAVGAAPFRYFNRGQAAPLRNALVQMSKQNAENFVGFCGFRVGFLESPHWRELLEARCMASEPKWFPRAMKLHPSWPEVLLTEGNILHELLAM